MTRAIRPACWGGLCLCGGRYWVVDSKVDTELNRRVRYLGCRACGCRPKANKWVIPLDDSPSRSLPPEPIGNQPADLRRAGRGMFP